MQFGRKMTAGAAAIVAALALSSGVAGAAHGSTPLVTGTVTSVNGDIVPGDCGTAGASGSFTVVTGGATPKTYTVTVTDATNFVQKNVTGASFANVCVGDVAGAIGVDSLYTLAADSVSVRVAKDTHVFGSVTSVNGSSDSSACGTAGAAGQFTLSTLIAGTPVVDTVYVVAGTDFKESGSATGSFGTLCVGASADAKGPSVDNSVLARLVVFHPPSPLHVKGTVASVNGDNTAGTCGVAGATGSFVIAWTNATGGNLTTTVQVDSTTTFSGKSGVTSFGDVCVGAKSGAIGPDHAGVLDALSVATYPVKA